MQMGRPASGKANPQSENFEFTSPPKITQPRKGNILRFVC